LKAAGIAAEAPPGTPVLSATTKEGIELLQMSLPFTKFQLPSRLLPCSARMLQKQRSKCQTAFQATAMSTLYIGQTQDSNTG